MTKHLDKIINDAVTNPALSDSAEDIGRDLVDALIGELTIIKHPAQANQNMWSSRKEAEQEQIINRLKDRVRSVVTQAFGQILSAGNPAAQAKLKDVKFSGDKITAGLEIDVNCKERHALADFASRYVAVIMPDDISEYFESMSEISATKDQKSLPLVDKSAGGKKPAPAASEGESAEPEINADDDQPQPTGDDIELFHALQENGITPLLDTIMIWGSEYREAAWQYIEDLEEGLASTPPAFLTEFMDEKAAATPAGAESDAAPADAEPVADEKPLEDMSKPELVAEAILSATSIGEASVKDGDDGITESQFKRKNKPDLVDYIKYARGKLSQIATDTAVDQTTERADDALQSDDPLQPGMDDVNMLEAEPPMLINELKTVLGLDIPLDDASEWSEPTRREIRAYLTQISKGIMPERVPTDLGPYLSAND